MSCLFHDWIYSEWRGVEAQGSPEDKYMCFKKRTCGKCGKIQENKGVFMYNFDKCFGHRDMWFTIGYKKVKS